MMKRRSKYSTSGAGRDSERRRGATGQAGADASAPHGAQQNPQPQVKPPHQSEIPTPFAGKPLDGSQYLDVIEEQKYSEQRPAPEHRGGRSTPDVPD